MIFTYKPECPDNITGLRPFTRENPAPECICERAIHTFPTGEKLWEEESSDGAYVYSFFNARERRTYALGTYEGPWPVDQVLDTCGCELREGVLYTFRDYDRDCRLAMKGGY